MTDRARQTLRLHGFSNEAIDALLEDCVVIPKISTHRARHDASLVVEHKRRDGHVSGIALPEGHLFSMPGWIFDAAYEPISGDSGE